MSANPGSRYISNYRNRDSDWDRRDGSRRVSQGHDWNEGSHEQATAMSQKRPSRSISSRSRSRSPYRDLSTRQASAAANPPKPARESNGKVTKSLVVPPSAGIARGKTNPFDLTTNSSVSSEPVSVPPTSRSQDPRLLNTSNNPDLTKIEKTDTHRASSPERSNLSSTLITTRLDPATRKSTSYQTTVIPAGQDFSPPCHLEGDQNRQSLRQASVLNLLGVLADQISRMAALKVNCGKAEAKVKHLSDKDGKLAGHAKLFPAFVEQSLKEKAQSEKIRDSLEEQLTALQARQNESVGVVAELIRDFQASLADDSEHLKQQMMQQVTTIHKDLEKRLDLSESGLKEHSSEISHSIQTIRADMSHKIADLQQKLLKLLDQMANTTDDLSAIMDECRSNRAKYDSRLTPIETFIAHWTTKLESVTQLETRDLDVSQRVGRLETQADNILKSGSLWTKKIADIEAGTRSQQEEIQKMRAEIDSARSEKLTAAVATARGQAQTSMMDDGSTSPNKNHYQELASMRSEIAALKSELREIKNDQDIVKFRHESQKFAESTNRLHLIVEELQQKWDQKIIEEDLRDELVASEMEKIKSILVQMTETQEASQRRWEHLESTLQQKISAAAGEILKKRSLLDRSVPAGTLSPTADPESPSAPPVSEATQVQRWPSHHPYSVIRPTPYPSEISQRLADMESTRLQLSQQVTSIFHALQHLTHRVNCFTTEPIVRAMTRQLEIMYPYASNAQREIAGIKTYLASLREPLHSLEKLNGLVMEHSASLGALRTHETEMRSIQRESQKAATQFQGLLEELRRECSQYRSESREQGEIIGGIGDRVLRLEGSQTECSQQVEKLKLRITDDVSRLVELKCTEAVNEKLLKGLDAWYADKQRQNILESFTSGSIWNSSGKTSGDSQGAAADNEAMPKMHMTVNDESTTPRVPQATSPGSWGSTAPTRRARRIKKKKKGKKSRQMA